MGKAQPLHIPMDFDEAIRRALQVPPQPRPAKRKRRGGTPKGRKKRGRLAA